MAPHQIRIVLGLYLSLLGCPAEEGPGPNEPLPTKPTATNDAGLTETLPPPITDAGINNPPMPADAGGTIPAPAIDAGNTVLEPASDAGNTIPTGTIDSGNLNEGPPSDAGTLTPSEPTDAGHGAATDGGTSVIPLCTVLTTSIAAFIHTATSATVVVRETILAS